MKRKVYLAGAIGGLTYDQSVDWREYVKKRLDDYNIVGLSPMRAKHYLAAANVLDNTDHYDNPLSTDRGVTARDRFDVMNCDLVLFNLLGAPRVSIGTCIEFGWADAYRKPKVVLYDAMHDHCMIRDLADFVVKDLEEAIHVITGILEP